VQADGSPLIWHHPDYYFLGFGENEAAAVAPRLPISGPLYEIGRPTGRKATIVQAKPDQPSCEQRFHGLDAIVLHRGALSIR
jgi:hypothetical protein